MAGGSYVAVWRPEAKRLHGRGNVDCCSACAEARSCIMRGGSGGEAVLVFGQSSDPGPLGLEASFGSAAGCLGLRRRQRLRVADPTLWRPNLALLEPVLVFLACSASDGDGGRHRRGGPRQLGCGPCLPMAGPTGGARQLATTSRWREWQAAWRAARQVTQARYCGCWRTRRRLRPVPVLVYGRRLRRRQQVHFTGGRRLT